MAVTTADRPPQTPDAGTGKKRSFPALLAS